jgi:hypothetical protein
MPPEVILYGEANILKSLSDAQPDFIIFIPRNMAEYGVDLFGEGPNYGSNIMAWISEGYEKVWQESDYQQADSRLAISILKRKTTDTH